MWRVLLADPDRHEQERLTRACARFGRVICVSTAARLWRELAVRGADLLVLEHRLPDGSGLDLLAVLKARWPEIPAIMATASGSEAVCAAALKLGIRDYFIKPWAPSEVVASLRRILGVPRSRRDDRRDSFRLPRGLAGRMESRGEGDAVAIRQAAQRIQEDLEDPVSFGQLALELRLSKPALSRRFTRTIGISYRRLVNDARIARARELLCSSSYSVTEIAQLVGFGDLPRFDKVFKAAVGASPSQYRQQQTSEGNKLLADSAGS
jgi:AraC-like DNA-binding protein/ActR/RegA family two-component response regulator